MFYEINQYVINSKELSIQIGNKCHFLRGELEYMATDDYPEVAIISQNLGKVEGLCRNLLQTIAKKGDTKPLLRRIYRYVAILIKYSTSIENYVNFDDTNTKQNLITAMNECNKMITQIDSFFNKAYSSFLTQETETPQPIEKPNELDFQGQVEFPSLALKQTIKEKNMRNIAKLAADLREVSLTACNRAHEMQNIIYKNFNDMDSAIFEKINGVCGQVENQTRAINNLLYKMQKNPSDLNDNQLEQAQKQVFNKLENIKTICKENQKSISMLSNKQVSEELETYNTNLMGYSSCVI